MWGGVSSASSRYRAASDGQRRGSMRFQGTCDVVLFYIVLFNQRSILYRNTVDSKHSAIVLVISEPVVLSLDEFRSIHKNQNNCSTPPNFFLIF